MPASKASRLSHPPAPPGWRLLLHGALRRLLPGLAALYLLFSPPGEAAAASPEYQVKAAFIYNFLKFVEWPSDGAPPGATISVGILGKDPFGDALEAVNGKLAKGRRVVVLHYRSVEEVKECDLLFICGSEKGRLAQILKGVQRLRTLTVADQEGFCEAGGMINLVSINNRVGFEVNVAAATRARLRISSRLLKLAHNVFE